MTMQHIAFRTRRSYNKWVADETLEDYALRFTAKKARRWSYSRVANTALGAISFLALEAIGATITIQYGFSNAIAAIFVVSIIIFLTSIPISYYAAKYGVDIDLLTRGAGFGYVGSTISSLIYASFTFIFFALEAAIMAMALKILFGLPLAIGYILSSLVVLPIVAFGITSISRFQSWTQPLWVILQLVPFIFVLIYDFDSVSRWTEYGGIVSDDGNNGSNFSYLYFGAASAVLFALIAQIGEQVDFLRFVKPPNSNQQKQWFFAWLIGGPGWIGIGILKLLAGSFLAILALYAGLSISDAADPTQMYIVAYQYVTNSPNAILLLVGVFVLLCQLKINVTNAYAGSIAWSNFFSRLTHSHPGRVVWLVFNVMIAIILMELGVYHALESTLSIYATVAVAWIGSVVADLVVNKPLGISPPHIEFKRAHLYDINPVGVGSMLAASVIGIVCHIGWLGEESKSFASYIAFFSAFILAPVIGVLTRGKYYLARENSDSVKPNSVHKCCICEHEFESEDTTYCPFYKGKICSLCCSLDSSCMDACRPKARMQFQLMSVVRWIFPEVILSQFSNRFWHFMGVFFLITFFIATIFTFIYYQIPFQDILVQEKIFKTLVQVFVVLLIFIGVVTWLFVLARESRQVALEESQRHTMLLAEEIAAHKETAKELQGAQRSAESANQAKSRYLSGISHELRSPLNALLGYAQLLEQADDIPESRQKPITIIRRSGEYLSSLIEGLLDISKIEVGKLEIHRNLVNFPQLMEQILYLARYQADAKNISFTCEYLNPVPEFIKIDEKRLRQILTNLISNAINFTEQGGVTLSISYRNQVAKFAVKDTGVGVAKEDLERIFRPFERVQDSEHRRVPGTGLGLTITQLMTEILGGDLQIESELGKGSVFTLSILLSDASPSYQSVVQSQKIVGYFGSNKTILITDDDPSHRSLISDLLSPMGFIVLEAVDYETCMSVSKEKEIDLFLLDVSMPGRSGYELAKALRENFRDKPIIMVSADAGEGLKMQKFNANHNDYLVKPIQLRKLLETLAHYLSIEWKYEPANPNNNSTLSQAKYDSNFIPQDLKKQLIASADVGNANAFSELLNQTENKMRLSELQFRRLSNLAENYRFEEIVSELSKKEEGS